MSEMRELERPLPSLLPFAELVRKVPTEAPFYWLGAGWRDFKRSRGLSAAYSFVFVVAGFFLTGSLGAAELEYLIPPLAAGFLLVGPALTVGFYAISRDLEAGHEPSAASAMAAWRSNPKTLLIMGAVALVFLFAWLRVAAVVYALSFPDAGFDWERALTGTLLHERGLVFLGIGTAVGAVMATIAFVAGAFSLPLILDRRIGLAEAVAISATAVVLNARTMAVWAGLIVVFTAAGLACWYLGLCITLPLIGHATWHAYRAVIRPAD